MFNKTATIIVVLAFLLGITTSSTTPSPARFQGPLFQGVGSDAIITGGSSFTIQLIEGRFQEKETHEIREMLANSFYSNARESHCWNEIASSALGNAKVSISSHRRFMKVHLGAAPQYNCSKTEVISVVLPAALVDGTSTVEGPKFLIVPDGRLTFTNMEGWAVTSTTINLKFEGDDIGSLASYGYSIVSGTDCKGTRATLTEAPSWNPTTQLMSFTTTQGGIISVCYPPDQDHLDLLVRAKGQLVVSGPEGFVADNPTPRAQTEFKANIYGTNLTAHDLLVVTTNPCSDPVDPAEVYDITLSSPSRASCYVSVETQGLYNICYLRSQSVAYTLVTSITVEKGGDVVVEKDAAKLIVSEDTLVVRPIHVVYLTVDGGMLSLERHTMNVSNFEWLGGDISGAGLINVMSRSHINGGERSLLLDFALHNFGNMKFSLRYLMGTSDSSFINNGMLQLKVNSTDVADAAHWGCQGKSAIINNFGGRIHIDFSEGGKLIVTCPFINKGTLIISGQAQVVFRSVDFHEGSLMNVTRDASVMFEKGTLRGVIGMDPDSVASFKEGPFSFIHTRLSGPGTTSIESTSTIMDSMHVSDRTALFFRGNTSNAQIEVYGYNRFDETTTVAMGTSTFLSKGSIAHLLIKGRLLCHIPTVKFGENVIVHAELTTVMFGVGQQGIKHATLKPQSLDNSSFIVPPDATLIIMDIGVNTTQQQLVDTAEPPKICANYLVVPMHVEAHGKILLWGCAVLPLGGQHSGLVFGASAEEMNATLASLEFAFCRQAQLPESNLCHAVFPQNATKSGLALGGEHRFLQSLGGDPVVNVDTLEVLPQGLVAADGALQLLVREGAAVHADGRLSLVQGGLVSGKVLTVNGIVDIQSHRDVKVEGRLDVGPTGSVRVSVDGTCQYPMTVRDAIRFAHGASVQCARPLNLSTGASAAMIQTEGDVIGIPSINISSCTSSYTAKLILARDSVGFRIVDNKGYITTKQLIAGTALSLLLAIALLISLSFRMSPSQFIGELKRRLEIPLQLSFPEFSSYLPNYVGMFSMFLDAMFLTSTAFHPLIPLPNLSSLFVNISTHTMLIHITDGSKVPLLVTTLVLVFIWILLWLPLALKKVSERMKNLLHEREHYSHRYAVQLLFQFHTVASTVALGLFIPILSYLTDPIACSTILANDETCVGLRRLMGPCILGAGAFAYLAPYSANCQSFPFGHPPYQKELDLRFKRSFLFCQYSLYCLQVCVWKVFAHSPIPLLVSSLIIVTALFSITVYSTPCAYSNINSLKTMSLLFPIWSIVCSLVQVLRFGDQPQFVCSISDPLYIALMILGFVVIVVGIVASLRRCVQPIEDGSDSAISIHLHSLMDNYNRIEKRKMEMYNTDDMKERETISDNISALRIQYLQLLNAYRRKKERFLLPYYLGDSLGGALLVSQLGYSNENDTPKSMFDVPMKTIVSADDDDEHLSTEQMESFVRGPPLGRGSYGVVHMGMLASGKLVAVKEVPISRKKKGVLSSVKKEVDLLRTLVHPNVIRYYGCYVTTKQMSVFMEFAVGGSLTSLIRKFDKLSEGTMQTYAQQILTGLHYLHARNIVHRDIKGENILIDGAGVAKLADFGCSKGLADISNKSQQGCGTLVGSPYWMAPEVIKNEEYGTKADIWSVGCTVVEMLNGGEPPWHEKFDNVYSAMYFIGSTTDLPSNMPSNVSELCKDFLSRCFERDVSKRASAAELLKHPWLSSAEHKPSPTSTTDDSPLNQREWSDLFESGSDGTAMTTMESTMMSKGASQPHTLNREVTDSLALLQRTESPIQ